MSAEGRTGVGVSTMGERVKTSRDVRPSERDPQASLFAAALLACPALPLARCSLFSLDRTNSPSSPSIPRLEAKTHPGRPLPQRRGRATRAGPFLQMSRGETTEERASDGRTRGQLLRRRESGRRGHAGGMEQDMLGQTLAKRATLWIDRRLRRGARVR